MSKNNGTKRRELKKSEGKIWRWVTGTTHPRPSRRAGRPPEREPPTPGPSAGGATV